MKGLLAPFEEAAETVQENLVTRNGEVEAEMQRMRMLLARVGGRVGQLKEGQQGGGEEGWIVVGEVLGCLSRFVDGKRWDGGWAGRRLAGC